MIKQSKGKGKKKNSRKTKQGLYFYIPGRDLCKRNGVV